MKEEDFIRGKFGRKESFTVPDNYFADFAEKLMNELPQQKERRAAMTAPAKVRHLRYWLASAAAVCCLAFAGTWVYMHRASAHPDPVASVHSENVIQNTSASEADAVYVEDLLDYALVDNSEIAMYLTGSN